MEKKKTNRDIHGDSEAKSEMPSIQSIKYFRTRDTMLFSIWPYKRRKKKKRRKDAFGFDFWVKEQFLQINMAGTSSMEILIEAERVQGSD